MIKNDKTKAALYDMLRPNIRGVAHQMEADLTTSDDITKYEKCSDEFISELEMKARWEFEGAMKKRVSPTTVWKVAAKIMCFVLLRAASYERDYKNKS